MKFVFVDNPAVSANPDVAANVDIPAKSENVAKPALCEFVENPDIVATPAILAKVAIPAKSEKVANPALFASVADIEVVIVPVANPVTIKLLSMNTEFSISFNNSHHIGLIYYHNFYDSIISSNRSDIININYQFESSLMNEKLGVDGIILSLIHISEPTRPY